MRDVAGDPGGDEPDAERPGVATLPTFWITVPTWNCWPQVERALRDHDAGRGQVGQAAPGAWSAERPGRDPDRPLVEPGPLVGDRRVDRLGQEVAVLDDRDGELGGRRPGSAARSPAGSPAGRRWWSGRRGSPGRDVADGHVAVAAGGGPGGRQDDPGPGRRGVPLAGVLDLLGDVEGVAPGDDARRRRRSAA